MTNETSERLLIVQTAAKIIKEDICTAVFDCNMYPDFGEMKEETRNLVPVTITAFTDTHTSTKTQPIPESITRKRTFINHSIISAIRPRSFLSPLHLGLSVHLYRCYGSRHLVDMMHSVGACSSYRKATNFLNCAVNSPADWKMHIEPVKRMLPYFHSAGHLHYAKCAHLYLTLMEDLPNKMPSEDFQGFTKDGYFTIRRSDRFWSGVSTDMCIEQVLMRGFRAIGGLTHGRGITDSTLQRWVLSAPVCVEISETLSEFAGVSITDGQ